MVVSFLYVAKTLGRMLQQKQGEFIYEAMTVKPLVSGRSLCRAARQNASASVYSQISPQSNAFLIQEVQKGAEVLGRAPLSTHGEFPYRMTVVRCFLATRTATSG
ncbi:hypothetical protein HB848_00010 [Listeria rocourtiae]|uniref:hypothetical protein n=1 Tax=Listeria rocourtiae TaxID=647910 RepID=UPI001627005C|nr:hypothetical protein [Listeria rocourtiae]MBC1433721.1 hypothetical protein [Listeria rocourtiae]